MVRGAIASSFRARGRSNTMPILLWLLGVPIPIIIILVLLAHH
jgi:hypothetical protein